MRRFWSDLLASLYNIRDGIVQKKQELDEERAACEQEKEELRGRIAELEENQGTESIILEPVAIGKQYEGDYIIQKFSSSQNVTDSADSRSLMFIYDRSQFDNNNNNLVPKRGKLYIIDNNSNNNAYFIDNLDYLILNLLNVSLNKLYNRITRSYDIDPNNVINEDNFVLEDLFIIIYNPTI